MVKIVNQTRSEQIAAKLRRDIIDGKLRGGTSLKSIRQLAADFEVGRQVIHSALQTLEKEQLLESRDRQGFLIRDRRTSMGTGVLFLAYGVNADNPYLCSLQALTGPPYLPEGFNSWSRIVPRKLASQENWEMELHRISGISGIDFLFLHAADLSKEQISMTQTLPFPVIFLADFSCPENVNLPISQVVDSAEEETVIAMDYLKKNAGNSIAMFIYSTRHEYNRRYLERARKEAELRNMELLVYTLPDDFTRSSENEEYRILLSIFDEIPPRVSGLFLAGIPYFLLEHALPDVRNRFRILSSNGRNSPEIPHLDADFTPLFQKLFSLCSDKKSGKEIIGRHVVPLNYRILPGKE